MVGDMRTRSRGCVSEVQRRRVNIYPDIGNIGNEPASPGGLCRLAEPSTREAGLSSPYTRRPAPRARPRPVALHAAHRPACGQQGRSGTDVSTATRRPGTILVCGKFPTWRSLRFLYFVCSATSFSSAVVARLVICSSSYIVLVASADAASSATREFCGRY